MIRFLLVSCLIGCGILLVVASIVFIALLIEAMDWISKRTKRGTNA